MRGPEHYFLKACPRLPADLVGFFAEIDLLDLSVRILMGDCSATHFTDTTECVPLEIEGFVPKHYDLRG